MNKKYLIAPIIAVLCLMSATPQTNAQDTESEVYLINPDARRQINEGWGVSLSWWANMCGKWSDDKIDKIVDWLVSPTGLNYNVFRYNIGGGDDPSHTHMIDGKGERAMMEGFKDSSNGDYIWTRDAAQRKIMLKIKEKRPDAIFEAYSNTPPYYMTVSGCASGNSGLFGLTASENLNSNKYEEFARYLVDVCKHYKDVYGIEFRTLEPFNEPNTNYWKKNGDQEGCKFSPSSQVNFIKVLYPMLQESGLNTVISASDETNVSSAIESFNQFKRSNILHMVGQFNTHSYDTSTTPQTCSQFNSLVREAGKRLWMSESGPLSTYSDGYKGCLEMVKRMFDDVRYLECESWHDWQYIEEWDERWCLVKASFGNQTYERVKNYYLRQQVTRFIKPGYHFIASPNENTLAAVSQHGDTIVLVALNQKEVSVRHEARLMNCEPKIHPYAYFTSASASMFKTACQYENGVLSYTMPAQSVATFIIPLEERNVLTEEIYDGGYYMIQPQYNRNVTLTASNGSVTIGTPSYSDGWTSTSDNAAIASISGSQLWKLDDDGSGAYTLTNADGIKLYASGSSLSTTEGDNASTFTFDNIENHSYKITCTNNGQSFELQSKKTTAGTKVVLANYGSDVSQGHRNWQLVPVAMPDNGSSDVEPTLTEIPVELTIAQGVININTATSEQCNIAVYTLNGICNVNINFSESIAIPIAKGYYVVRVTTPSGVLTKTIKVN